MASSKGLGCTNPDLDRSNIYDSSGDRDQLRTSDLLKAHGNSEKCYSAEFIHLSNTNAKTCRNFERYSVGIEQNAELDLYGLGPALTLKDSGLGVSKSANRDTDYNADRTSNLSSPNNDTLSRGNVPTWRKLLLDPELARDFLSRQWPRVSLRASFKRNGPYVAPDEDGKGEEVRRINKDNGSNKKTIATLVLIILGVILVAAAMIPVVILTGLSDDNGYTDYILVNMSLSVNKPYVSSFDNKSTIYYRRFTDEFCTEVGNIYQDENKNNSLQGYYGCKVTNLSPGSIVVTFMLFYTSTTATKVQSDVKAVLVTFLHVNSYYIGQIEVINNTIQIHSVTTERYFNSPIIQEARNVESSSSSISLIRNDLSSIPPSFTLDISSSVLQIDSLSVNEPLFSSALSSKLDKHSTFISSYLDNTPTKILEGVISTITIDTTATYSTKIDTIDVSTIIPTGTDPIKSSMFDSESYQYMSSSVIINGDSYLEQTSTQNLITDGFSKTSNTTSGDTTVGQSKQVTTVSDDTTETTTMVTTFVNQFLSTTTTNSQQTSKFYATSKTADSIHETSDKAPTIENSSRTTLGPERTTVTKSSLTSITDIFSGVTSKGRTIETVSISTKNLTEILQEPTTLGFSSNDPLPTSNSDLKVTTVNSVNRVSTTDTTKTTTVKFTKTTVNVTKFIPSDIEKPTSLSVSADKNSVTKQENTVLEEGTTPPTFRSTALRSSLSHPLTHFDLTSGSASEIFTTLSGTKQNIEIENTTPAYLKDSTTEMSQAINCTNINGMDLFVPAEEPFMELSPDQVVDLVFPSQLYYRDGEEHICTGNVGVPQGTIQVDFQYPGTDNFRELPNEYLYITSRRFIYQTNCKNVEEIKFAVRFTDEMQGGRLRCYVTEYPGVEVISQNLTLVPRNICSCAENGQRRGHPTNCNRFVECVEDEIMYPHGRACSSGQCRDSLDGTCSEDCSVDKCGIEVPKEFCIQPTPTPNASDFVSCNSSFIPRGSGPFDFLCELFNSSFKLINATYRESLAAEPRTIAVVHENGSVTDHDDNVTVTYSMNVVTFHFDDSLCKFDGYYGIFVSFGETREEKAEGKLVITYDAGKPTLSLNADQISDLGFYRKDRLNYCVSDIGNPPQKLKVDFLYPNGSLQHIVLEDSVNNNRCEITIISFGIAYTTEMEGGSVRCGYEGREGDDDIYDEKKVALIPRGICKCGSKSKPLSVGSPSSCDVFVICQYIEDQQYPFGLMCPVNQCRNSLTGICSTNCSPAVCNQPVPSDFCEIIYTTPIPSPDIRCNDTDVEVNTGPVIMHCTIDNSSFSLINATYKESWNTQPRVIATIQKDGNIATLDDIMTVNYIDQTVTFLLENATCAADGYFGIYVSYEETGVLIAEAKINVTNGPGDLALTLHPDQIMDLGFYRVDLLHECKGDAGNPPGIITADFIYRNGTCQPILILSTDDDKYSCHHDVTIKFGINFKSEMDGGKVRCTIVRFGENVTQVEEPVSLIPRNICACAPKTGSPFVGNPNSCTSYVECATLGDNNTYPYGRKCRHNKCRDSLSGQCSSNCSVAVCDEPVPENFCWTDKPELTTEIHPSSDDP